MATAGLVLGILGLPTLGLTSLAGAVLGHLALNRIERTGGGGRNQAIAGITLGWIGVVVLVVAVSFSLRSVVHRDAARMARQQVPAPAAPSAPASTAEDRTEKPTEEPTSQEPTGEPTEEPTAERPPDGAFGDGTYRVGSEIKPGTYRTDGEGDLSVCYVARKNNANEEIGSINDNQIVQGQGYVTVEPSDRYVQFSGGCTWKRR
ncbi:DUF4190 domain-containing protein [Actinomadura kijaniata]|uniref:DUF4190 domain-containing protein n=1 Tax=Actinomadura kijaniata TaxID=46161 RepID=UPI003F1BA018